MRGGGPAPAALHVTATHVQAGESYAATFAVCGYPAEVGPAWLSPLLSTAGRVTVGLHVTPIPAQVAAPMLTRQRARLESTRRIDADRGRLADPRIDAAAADAADLAERVARGASKLYAAAVYVTVFGRTIEELHDTSAAVRAAAASMLLDLQPATFRHHLGYTTTLPLGVDALGMHRVFDTSSLAASFPFASADLPGPTPGLRSGQSAGPDAGPDTGRDAGQGVTWRAGTDAVLYGVNTTSQGVLMWDRWAQDTHNSVVLARSGAGKSYFVKLDVLRSLYQGVEVAVIDPEDEYAALAHHVGGTVLQLGLPGVHLNPLDLPLHHGPGPSRDRSTTLDGGRAVWPVLPADTLRRRQLALHTVIAVLLGAAGRTPAVDDAELASLDRAITATYTAAGITHDPATWTRPAPLLRDLATALDADPDPAGRRLAGRLQPWTHGAFAELFAGPTTVRPHGHLVVWSLRHLPDELRTVGTLLALEHIWHRIDRPDLPDIANTADTASPAEIAAGSASAASPDDADGHRRSAARRRLVVVDEAWLLMRDPAGARFLYRMAKAARKRAAGLTVATQDADDLLGTDLGRAVVANAATQVLMRQAPQTIAAVTEAFGLTDGETRLLLTAARGEGLLIAGRARVPFRSIASPDEHRLATTGLESAGIDGDA
ncbi:DUF87 domain-containing protein [Dactylosporangium sp. AC04546]|uniref:VirB4 family type IV secretion system protein n=1 Tax=Dactylosporangium sp. AC04546 TaxID=2862460 RepID=UPI001EDCBDF4|nr:DUF87 domain-containing protein [Dactylosporangium sp. AC04546]WVK78936.1 DUF87 domain-containing protein [Dactylosporangium sp. AC04546]